MKRQSSLRANLHRNKLKLQRLSAARNTPLPLIAFISYSVAACLRHVARTNEHPHDLQAPAVRVTSNTGLLTRGLHGNGDGENPADSAGNPRERRKCCGNTAGIDGNRRFGNPAGWNSFMRKPRGDHLEILPRIKIQVQALENYG